jgi:hypothetical protein
VNPRWPDVHTSAGIARLLVAAVWLTFGIYYKVLRGVPRHERIVARILGDRIAPVLTRLIGLGEAGIGVWMLSGLWLPGCATVQTALVGTMNAIELRKARDLLLAPLPMVLGNTLLLAIAWYAALPFHAAPDRPVPTIGSNASSAHVEPQSLVAVTWPAGTVILARDRDVLAAVIHHDDLVLATPDAVVVAYPAGSRVRELARFAASDRVSSPFGVVDIFVVGERVVVRVDLVGEGPHPDEPGTRLFAVPFGGGRFEIVAEDLGWGSITGGGDAIWVARHDLASERVQRRKAPDFAKDLNLPAEGFVTAIAADEGGTVWPERRPDHDVVALRGIDGYARRTAVPARGYGLALDAETAYLTSAQSAADPGGPFGSRPSVIYAIDRASGTARLLAKDLSITEGIVIGADRLCVPVYDEQVKATAVLSISKKTGEARTLVRGLWNARCLAADPHFFYIASLSGRAQGVARVPTD